MLSVKHGNERVLIFDVDKSWISCNNADGFVLENCVRTNVDDDEVSFFDSDGCWAPKIKDQELDSSKTFKFNMLTKEKHFPDDITYPTCPEVSNWNVNNISSHILSWKMSLLKNSNPFWFFKGNQQPLDLDNPTINITLDMFVNRKYYFEHQVIIRSFRRTLFEGLLINGTVTGKISVCFTDLGKLKLFIVVRF
jgi:hypothetical protein